MRRSKIQDFEMVVRVDDFGIERAHLLPKGTLVSKIRESLGLVRTKLMHLNTTCAFGVHLTPTQLAQLSHRSDRTVFITFDSDPAGQHASGLLAQKLRNAAINLRIVDLPAGHDPNSYFLAGASAAEFQNCLRQSR
jgi:hypothetical protein